MTKQSFLSDSIIKEELQSKTNLGLNKNYNLYLIARKVFWLKYNFIQT